MKITQKFYDPAAFSKPVPRRDHGSRADVERAGWSAQVINRGEQLSYIDALLGEVIAEVSIPGDWIDADTLDQWDFEPARPIGEAQRRAILERITQLWAGYVHRPLRVISGAQLRAAEKSSGG